MKCLLTGASGFVGRALCERLLTENYEVIAPCRSPGTLPANERLQSPLITGLNGDVDWQTMLSGANVVVHLAARAHIMRDTVSNPLTEYRKINVEGTLNLARQAAQSGAKRFVYISSIKVNGEETFSGQPFTTQDTPSSVDPYAISKYEAEIGLQKLAKETGLEVVIIRPPLVYGPEVKANFLRMIHWLKKGVPLPLGDINNVRSFVFLDNLVDLIIICLNHPNAANQTFLVSDGEDLSTTEILKRLAKHLGVSTRLIPIPAVILKMGFLFIGRPELARRLCGSLQVDISKNHDLLNWTPLYSVDTGLNKTVSWYLNRDKNKL